MPEINKLEALSGLDTAALVRELQSRLSSSNEASTSEASPAEPPKLHTRRARKKKNVVLYLTEEQLASLFNVISKAGNLRDAALFAVAYRRGFRASEVGMLQLSHLRIAQRRLMVQRLKGGTSGEFLLTDAEVKALKAYLRVRGNDAGPLFPSRNHRPISRRRLDELMKEYGSAAGLPRELQHFHCLRHSCGTQLLERGAAIEEVQDHLGHTDIRNTMIYAKVTNRKRLAKDLMLQKEF